MAAPRAPGIGDARIPCPLCGGLIHPVAGRCKHCKEDLTQFRAGRPQAAAELPRLDGTPVPTNGTNGHVAAYVAVPVAVPAHEVSQPILPPRPTGRSMKAESPRSTLWRSWPMIVIMLAVASIVVATIVMVMPPDKKGGERKLMSPPPAPERMETNPMPPSKQSQVDPWDQPGGGGSPNDPLPPPPPPPPAPANPDPDDLLGQLPQSPGSAFMLAMFDKACKKLKTCPGVDQAMMSTICDQFSSMMPPAVPTSCPAAQRCLDAIDKMSCSQADNTSPLSAVYLISDCTTAMRDC